MNNFRFKWEQRQTEKEGRTHVSQAGFYNNIAWKKLRNKLISEEPVCVLCAKEGLVVQATVIDHIIPLTLDNMWKIGLDESNLQPLCTPCHITKTNRDKSKKYNPDNLLKGKELKNKFETF